MPKEKGANQGGQSAAAAKKARDERNRKRRAARAKAARKKKQCNKTVTDKQKKHMQENWTPSTKVTNMVNNKSPKPLKCALCGRGAPFALPPPSTKFFKQLSADHIVPVSQIVKKPGFACLTPENQKKVLNNPKNFAIPGVCPSCNLSRQDTKWDKWAGHETFGITKPGKAFAAKMAGKAPGLSKGLGEQIGKLL